MGDAEGTARHLVEPIGAVERPADAASPTGAAALARHLYRLRRMRETYFKAALFGEPGWDILLDLFVARVEQRQVSTSSACIGAAVPATTALRWIRQLEQEGLVVRYRARRDERLNLIEISDEGYERMTALLLRLSTILAVPKD